MAANEPQGSPRERATKPIGLSKRSEFVRVQKNGRRFKGRYMVLLLSPGPEPTGRIGFTVSRKVGNAVIRNRVRRRLREIVRCSKALSPGFDHVVVAYTTASDATFAVLNEELQCLLKRAQSWASASSLDSPSSGSTA